MRLTILMAWLALFTAPAGAQDHPLLKAGEEAYNFMCAKCHGKHLVNPGTSSFDLRSFPQDQKQRFFDSVNNGKGDMPAWADVLLEGELDALWVYVATRAGTEPFPEDAAAAPQTITPGTLTACLSRNAGALAGRRFNGGTGFDYRVSKSLAEQLGLEHSVVWIESDFDGESDPVRQTYALLAYDLCDIAPSHPMYVNAVGKPPARNARLPRWLGMPMTIDPVTERKVARPLPLVALKPVSVTRPYMRAEIGLAYRGGDPEPGGLADLEDRILALQQDTLSGAIVQVQAPGIASRAEMFNPGSDFLWKFETGTADVAIVDVAAFDAHTKHNPASTLRLAAWRHAIGLDIGIAVLSENQSLITRLNEAIDRMHEDDIFAPLAASENFTYAAPRFDGLQSAFTLRTLLTGH